MPIEILAREGRLFSAAEHEAFINLVLVGGEVAAGTLRGNVPVARCLAYLRDGESLLGVGALKNPLPAYRQSIRRSAGVAVEADGFPFELGYVFVVPEARRRGYSAQIVEAALGGAEGQGVFATARADNPAMHATLRRFGFARAGNEYEGRNQGDRIQLFLRAAG